MDESFLKARARGSARFTAPMTSPTYATEAPEELPSLATRDRRFAITPDMLKNQMAELVERGLYAAVAPPTPRDKERAFSDYTAPAPAPEEGRARCPSMSVLEAAEALVAQANSETAPEPNRRRSNRQAGLPPPDITPPLELVPLEPRSSRKRARSSSKSRSTSRGRSPQHAAETIPEIVLRARPPPLAPPAPRREFEACSSTGATLGTASLDGRTLSDLQSVHDEDLSARPRRGRSRRRKSEMPRRPDWAVATSARRSAATTVGDEAGTARATIASARRALVGAAFGCAEAATASAADSASTARDVVALTYGAVMGSAELSAQEASRAAALTVGGAVMAVETTSLAARRWYAIAAESTARAASARAAGVAAIALESVAGARCRATAFLADLAIAAAGSARDRARKMLEAATLAAWKSTSASVVEAAVAASEASLAAATSSRARAAAAVEAASFKALLCDRAARAVATAAQARGVAEVAAAAAARDAAAAAAAATADRDVAAAAAAAAAARGAAAAAAAAARDASAASAMPDEEDDLISEDSLDEDVERGKRVRILSSLAEGIITSKIFNGWRRVELDDGTSTDVKTADLEYLAAANDHVPVADFLPVGDGVDARPAPVPEPPKSAALEAHNFPDIIKGARVRDGQTGREGVVAGEVKKGGWAKVLWDGTDEAVSARPGLLAIIGDGSAPTDSSGRRKALKPTRGGPKPPRDVPAAASRRRGTIVVGTHVAVLPKPTVPAAGVGVITEVIKGGWRRVKLDGAARPEVVSFRVHMLEALDEEASSYRPAKRRPGHSTSSSPGYSSRPRNDHFFPGANVVIVSGDPESEGRRGVVTRVFDQNGWRKVTLEGSTVERNFRPGQLALASSSSLSSSDGRLPPSPPVDEHPPPRAEDKSAAAHEWPFPLGSRVAIIDDDKNAEAVGKIGVVTRVSTKGWRQIRREDTGEVKNYRIFQVHAAEAFEEDDARPVQQQQQVQQQQPPPPPDAKVAPEQPLVFDDPFGVGRRVRVCVEDDSMYDRVGVVTRVKQRCWRHVLFEDIGKTRPMRTIQLMTVDDPDAANKKPDRAVVEAERPRFEQTPFVLPPSDSDAFKVGARVRIKTEFLPRLGKSSEGVYGVGIVVEIGTAGWHRVVLENSKGGSGEVTVRRDRLRVLDHDLPDDDDDDDDNNQKEEVKESEEDRPPAYRHIARMCLTASAKKVLTDRSAKRTGMQRRICADDETPTCECISREAWNSQIARELEERRVGAGRRKKDEGEEEEPSDDDDRRKRRRSCSVDQPTVELEFENDEEHAYALRLENEKTIGVECDRDCLNRQLCVECVDSSCAHGERCQNRQFKRRQFKRVVVTKTPRCGWGLRAGEKIYKDEFIIEALGELVDKDEAATRLRLAEQRGEHNFYMFGCDTSSGLVIDATNKGNESRFANHSCDPSCELNKWRVGDAERYGFFARYDLNPGDEITFDYRFKQAFWHTTLQNRPCYCGAENCIGFFSSSGKAQSIPAKRARTPKRAQLVEAPAPAEDLDLPAQKRLRSSSSSSSSSGGGKEESTRLARAVRAAKAGVVTDDDDTKEDDDSTITADEFGAGLDAPRAEQWLRAMLKDGSLTRDDDFEDDLVFLELSNFDQDGPPFLASAFLYTDPPLADEERPSGPISPDDFVLDMPEPRPSIDELRDSFFRSKRRRGVKRVSRVADVVRSRRLAEIRSIVYKTKDENVRRKLIQVVDSVDATVNLDETVVDRVADDASLAPATPAVKHATLHESSA
ncbi:hypothetical protein CTAYLR_002651 [Chrysophaeum taylorii]|uniref:Histone-lysine N-methyltransferase n=1 Tax=Chrysophaeum taylorii TaxID=2483200 RepID=A0AAD7XKV6_9STRA|nr:hypothetical protein CTAYLR_002651 [Chrysophaeum taylorii]